ncbi:MAG: transporter suffix domain-containing protein [Mariprofundus sp.]|nr:transporter suffix domain-containing protein [Mariprofundus sp.]
MLGLFLFWLSWLLWALLLLVPFVLDAEVETIAVLSTSLLVVAEVSFLISMALLGRPFYLAIKLRVKTLWQQIFTKKPSQHSE